MAHHTRLHKLIEAKPVFPDHIVSLRDFSRSAVEYCIALALALEKAPVTELKQLAFGKCLGVMFYQPSTRTRMSFESGMWRIGGHVVGFADPTTTRATGFFEETLEDVVRFTAEMVDILVLRHPETGAALRAASVSPVPLINAGDGRGEHPTQSLGDIYHLYKHFGRIDGLTIGIVGHSGWRSHRSLITVLSLFDVKLALLEPPGLSLSTDIENLLRDRGTSVTVCSHINEVMQLSDAVTTLGVHLSNPHDMGTARQQYPTPESHYISAEAVKAIGRHLPILHPAPIADHIDRALDNLPQAHYFKQARDGMWMRTGLLATMCF